MANSRLGRVPFLNEDVAAVWICRKYSNNDNVSKDKYYDVAMVIHNRNNGKTCYFQNNLDSISDGPVISDPEASNVSSVWRNPSSTNGTNCANSHSNDSFIVTPHLVDAFAKLDLLNFHEPKGPYSIIGLDFVSTNNSIARTTNSCGSTCHYDANTSFSNDALAVGWMESNPPRANAWGYLFNISIRSHYIRGR